MTMSNANPSETNPTLDLTDYFCSVQTRLKITYTIIFLIGILILILSFVSYDALAVALAAQSEAETISMGVLLMISGIIGAISLIKQSWKWAVVSMVYYDVIMVLYIIEKIIAIANLDQSVEQASTGKNWSNDQKASYRSKLQIGYIITIILRCLLILIVSTRMQRFIKWLKAKDQAVNS